ncbi:MAG TPA: hypothetical protein VKR06_08400 [Ktedonosporobacter sp.]|nr:hypothetical protein [Ktedonosporobacter sp.]
MKTTPAAGEQLTLQPLLYLEILIASILPVAAILLVGSVGINQMTNANPNPGFFVLFFCMCAVGTFAAECALILFMQRAIKGQFSDLVAICQAFMAGDTERRAVILGNNELTPLLRAFNSLLDHVNRSSHVEQQQMQHYKGSQEAALLSAQLQQLLQELQPLAQSDLRVQASLPAGHVGAVADICNVLIEELTYFIQLMRSASEQVISASRNLLSRSIELAQTTETQLVNVARMNEMTEKLGEIAQGVYETDGDQDMAGSAEEMLDIAQSLTHDLEDFAQQLHLSSTKVLRAAELTGTLISLAEDWKGSVEHILTAQ